MTPRSGTTPRVQNFDPNHCLTLDVDQFCIRSPHAGLALLFIGVSKASPYRSEKRSHSEKKAPKMLRKVSHQPTETSDQFDCDLEMALIPRR